MLSRTVLGRSCWVPTACRRVLQCSRRYVHYDGRERLSNFWIPTSGNQASITGSVEGHELLIKAGFLRQAHSGIFHLLPLGLRVQQKIERLIDKHMLRLGAAKVSLSSLSSEELWQRSGRLDGRDSEFFRIQDRKGAKYLLAPTHEEEITQIVADTVHSYKDLPLRLYQSSRKYRDEARPRQGLLRGREFLMKDLYTFDASEELARQTYGDVGNAYRAFLDDLKLPYLVATADSGNMGGNLSHEYHFISDRGEDQVITCNTCDFSINDELGIRPYDESKDGHSRDWDIGKWFGISKDRSTLVVGYYPSWTLGDGFGSESTSHVSTHAVKAAFGSVDAGVENALETWLKTNPPSHQSGGQSPRCIHLIDPRIPLDRIAELTGGDTRLLAALSERDTVRTVEGATDAKGNKILLTSYRNGSSCPQCDGGKLSVQQAVEIGHTFHLGTRYSEPLDAVVLDANNNRVPVSMGCHGIGVSRLIGAVAALSCDATGLKWPLAIAPYTVVMVATKLDYESQAVALYDKMMWNVDSLPVPYDVVLDDRAKSLGWKLNDADLIGYPFIIVMGKAYAESKMVELQCRKLGIKEEVAEADVPGILTRISLDL